MNFNLVSIAILNINGVNYRCIINWISKSDAKTLMQNIDLNEKIVIKHKKWLSHVNIKRMPFSGRIFENVFFEKVILKMYFWGRNFDKYLSWLLIEMIVDCDD